MLFKRIQPSGHIAEPKAKLSLVQGFRLHSDPVVRIHGDLSRVK